MTRPWHLHKTLKYLGCCSEARFTEITLFVDGARDFRDQRKINDVIKVANSCRTQFKALNIIERQENYGCAASILEGVGEMLVKNDRIIVLEDDIIVSDKFLAYMNKALEMYQDKGNVFHINGFNYDVDTSSISNPQSSCHVIRPMFCWGWATWKDRWENMTKDPLANDPYYLIETIPKNRMHSFNLDGSMNWWQQVTANASGGLNTWAIFWFAFIFKSNGLCLTPLVSMTKNIGFDGSGAHCGGSPQDISMSEMIRDPIRFFPDESAIKKEDEILTFLLKKYFRRLHSRQNLPLRIIRKFIKMIR